MSTGRNEFKSLILNLNDLIIGSVNIHGKSISNSQALISNIKVRFKNVRNFGVHWYLKMHGKICKGNSNTISWKSLTFFALEFLLEKRAKLVFQTSAEVPIEC